MNGLLHNLCSIVRFSDKDFEVNFRSKECAVCRYDGQNHIIGTRGTNLYTINLSKFKSKKNICVLSKTDPRNTWLWHDYHI